MAYLEEHVMGSYLNLAFTTKLPEIALLKLMLMCLV